MDVFKSKPLKLASAAFYILLAMLCFYCACYRLPVGLKYGINLMMAGWALLMFFIRPMFNRAVFCMRFLALFFFPYLMFWMWSVAIWISESQTFDYILRGSLNIFYMVTNILFAAAAVYLFGGNAMLLTLIGMALANMLVALEVIAWASIGTFISEYIRLLVTFADDTGRAMRAMELHDMVYGWGVCALYYIIHKEKNVKKQVFCLLVSWLFFTMGFKRIAVPAVVGAAMLYIVLCLWKPKHLRALANIVALATGGGIFFYLWFIKSGNFVKLANELEINLMYRDIIYTYFSDFFELVPTYIGRGIRFIYTYCTEDPSYHLAVTALHNVYMETYIEVGFWCWWIWILHEIGGIAHRIQKRFNAECASAMLAMSVYVFLTFLTDNTTFYYPINVMYRMTIMTWCYETMRREHIPNANLRSQQELEDLRMEISIRKEGLKL